MLNRFTDFSDWPSFGVADFGGSFAPVRYQTQLRRELERLLGDFESAAPVAPSSLVTLADSGSSFVLQADVPGLVESDLHVSIAGTTLSLRGERKLEAPKNYSAHRRERQAFQFDKSFELPAKVDAEKATATLKHGVLTLTLPKVAEAQPRQISVTAA